jgi:hypothetical protein
MANFTKKLLRKIATNHSLSPKPMSRCAAAVLAWGASVLTASAAVSIPGQIVARPVTPGDIAMYGLPAATEVSGGLTAVALGTPLYLEVQVPNTLPATVTNVRWSLSAPTASLSVLTNGPLGLDVPIYEPADRAIYQVAAPTLGGSGRMLLRPDLPGLYTVGALVQASDGGSTNFVQRFAAGSYMGVNACALCHSAGGRAENMYDPWLATGHASIFTKGINGTLGYYSLSCAKCHTVGYDTNAPAANDGFDDVMSQTSWSFPTVLTNGNWDAMPYQLQNVANIQCENCHGPGSQHLRAFGNTNATGWPLLALTVNSGDCNQCHDAPTHHTKGTEWYASAHASPTRIPTGRADRAVCVRCHTASGFIGFVQGAATTNVAFNAISCQACHEPHGATPSGNPYQLRGNLSYTFAEGTVVTNAGTGGLCLNCHHSRNGSASNNVALFALGKPTWPGGTSFGVHDSPQGDMLEGVNAITYGKTIPSSAHRTAITNACVGCHMSAVTANDPAFLKAGGHTFRMSYSVVAGGLTNQLDKVDSCVSCHGDLPSFDLVRDDYNGDGLLEGVQTEIQHLLDALSTMLPNTNFVFDGLVKVPSARTNWPIHLLNAAYNWQYVNNDGSKGVHNAPFAVGLLKASISDLTGDPKGRSPGDSDLQFYAWQCTYFGSAASPNAAPNASPAGDGIPNWLKFTLGINPTVAGATNSFGGITWANTSSIGGTNADNVIQIYTAAEITFDTEIGTTYQIQAMTSSSDGWQNIGDLIPGTGKPVSYLTSTRSGGQQFYQVVRSP